MIQIAFASIPENCWFDRHDRRSLAISEVQPDFDCAAKRACYWTAFSGAIQSEAITPRRPSRF